MSGTSLNAKSAGCCKLAIRHLQCGAFNELAPHGVSEDGHELWKVVGEVRAIH
jgi:hypothetical protein